MQSELTERAKTAWNSIADEFNQWDALGLDEKETYVALTAALVDVPAVEPVATLRKALTEAAQELDRISCVPNVTETKDTYDQFQLAKAYADRGAAAAWAVLRSPPLSREGEDSAEVLKALKEAVEFANKANNYIAGQDLPASAGWLAVIAKADAALAATRSGSATDQKGCAE